MSAISREKVILKICEEIRLCDPATYGITNNEVAYGVTLGLKYALAIVNTESEIGAEKANDK